MFEDEELRPQACETGTTVPAEEDERERNKSDHWRDEIEPEPPLPWSPPDAVVEGPGSMYGDERGGQEPEKGRD